MDSLNRYTVLFFASVPMYRVNGLCLRVFANMEPWIADIGEQPYWRVHSDVRVNLNVWRPNVWSSGLSTLN